MATFMADQITSGLYHHIPVEPSPPTSGSKRELLIFAIYVEIGTQSESKARTRLGELRKIYNDAFREIESQTNYLIKTFVFPIKEGATRMECIFSGSNTKTGKANMEELFGSLVPEEDNAKGFTVGEKPATPPNEYHEYQGISSLGGKLTNLQSLYE